MEIISFHELLINRHWMHVFQASFVLVTLELM